MIIVWLCVVLWSRVIGCQCFHHFEEASLPIVLGSHVSLKDWTGSIVVIVVVVDQSVVVLGATLLQICRLGCSSPPLRAAASALLELICVHTQGFSLIPRIYSLKLKSFICLNPQSICIISPVTQICLRPAPPPCAAAQRSNSGSNLIHR